MVYAKFTLVYVYINIVYINSAFVKVYITPDMKNKSWHRVAVSTILTNM